MRELLENTAQRAISYLETLNDRGVAPEPEAVKKLATLDLPLTDDATPPEQVIKLLDEVCSPATMAMAGPRFFGFVIGRFLLHWAPTGSPERGTKIPGSSRQRPLPPNLSKCP